MMVLHTHIILATLLFNFKSIMVQASSSDNQSTGDTVTKEVNQTSPLHPPSSYRGRLHDPRDEDPNDFVGDSPFIAARNLTLKDVNQSEALGEVLEPSPTPNILDLVTPEKLGNRILSHSNKVQKKVPNNLNNNGHLNEVSQPLASNANKLNRTKVSGVVSRPPSPELAMANNISQSSIPTAVIDPSVSFSPEESSRYGKTFPLLDRLYGSFSYSNTKDEVVKSEQFVKSYFLEGANVRRRLGIRLKKIDDQAEFLENEKLDIIKQLQKLDSLSL